MHTLSKIFFGSGFHLFMASIRNTVFIILFIFISPAIQAQTQGVTVRVLLEDGRILEGAYKTITSSELVIIGASNQEFEFPLYAIEEVVLLQPEMPTRKLIESVANQQHKSNFNLNLADLEAINIKTQQGSVDQNRPGIGLNDRRHLTDKQEDKVKTGRFGIGYGTSYGGFGLNVTTKGKLLKLSAGGGYFPASMIMMELNEDIDFLQDAFLFNGGIKMYFGKKHKSYLHLQYGHFGVYALQIKYLQQGQIVVETEQHKLAGLTLLTGLDIPFGKTLGLNLSLGITRKFTEVPFINHDYFIATDLGLLFRF